MAITTKYMKKKKYLIEREFQIIGNGQTQPITVIGLEKLNVDSVCLSIIFMWGKWNVFSKNNCELIEMHCANLDEWIVWCMFLIQVYSICYLEFLVREYIQFFSLFHVFGINETWDVLIFFIRLSDEIWLIYTKPSLYITIWNINFHGIVLV